MADNELPFPSKQPNPDPAFYPQPPQPSSRLSITTPGLSQTVIDAPSVLAVAAPDINRPAEELMVFINVPSPEHAIALLAAAIAQIRYSYGETAIRRALASTADVTENMLDQIRTAPTTTAPPPDESLGTGPIGGGRIR